MAAASCQLTRISPCFVDLKIQNEEIKVSDVELQTSHWDDFQVKQACEMTIFISISVVILIFIIPITTFLAVISDLEVGTVLTAVEIGAKFSGGTSPGATRWASMSQIAFILVLGSILLSKMSVLYTLATLRDICVKIGMGGPVRRLGWISPLQPFTTTSHYHHARKGCTNSMRQRIVGHW